MYHLGKIVNVIVITSYDGRWLLELLWWGWGARVEVMAEGCGLSFWGDKLL